MAQLRTIRFASGESAVMYEYTSAEKTTDLVIFGVSMLAAIMSVGGFLIAAYSEDVPDYTEPEDIHPRTGSWTDAGFTPIGTRSSRKGRR